MRFTTARGALVALLAVVVMSVVGSASASAEACRKEAGSKKFVLCSGGEKVSSESVEVHLKSGTTAQFVWESSVPNPKFSCKSAEGHDSLRQNGGTVEESGGLASFLKCGEYNSPYEECKTEKLTISPRYGEVVPGIENLQFYKPSDELYGILHVEGQHCTIRGTFYISGIGPKCKITEAEAETLEHVVACDSPRELFIGGNAFGIDFELGMEFSGTKKGQKFSIIEGT
jgi:hypothetical protein